MKYSIVSPEKTAKDRSTLAYHFPSMPLVKYAKMAREYFFWKHVETAENMAFMVGKILVPAECIHWKRKKELQPWAVRIHRSSFYVLDKEVLNKNELQRYEAMLHAAAAVGM